MLVDSPTTPPPHATVPPGQVAWPDESAPEVLGSVPLLTKVNPAGALAMTCECLSPSVPAPGRPSTAPALGLDLVLRTAVPGRSRSERGLPGAAPAEPASSRNAEPSTSRADHRLFISAPLSLSRAQRCGHRPPSDGGGNTTLSHMMQGLPLHGWAPHEAG